MAAASVSWCIYRDIQIEKEYTGDLRNRIVGSRLQKDDHAPYFYKWKKGDNIRYYDPQNFDSLKVANITATPFFHQLIYPIADLEQRDISRIWLVIEYCILFIITAIAFSFAKNKYQQIAVIITTAIFLYANAWTGHIAAGQLYLFIPFLAMLFYSFINSNKSIVNAGLAGICAATLVLIRPNTILFLLPFMVFFNRYTVKYKVAFLSAALVIFFFAFNSNQKILYWKDYRNSLVEQLKSHQSLEPSLQHNDADPVLTNWEGWDMQQTRKDAQAFPYTYNMEHGNVFVLANHAFNIKTPVGILVGVSFFLMLALFFLFYRKKRYSTSFTIYNIAILSFCLYMITDIFSPIHRFQYNGTQWLFPLLLVAAGYHPRYKWVYIGIIAGLIINSLNLSSMVMEQALGEYIVFLFLLIFPFLYKPGTTK
ncbi:MAG: hypothetical protein ABUT20_00990 [Bacteroidota bacterium]